MALIPSDILALELLDPNGVFYAFAEYQKRADYLYTEMARVQSIPLPPPGMREVWEWELFRARYHANGN